jgi:hypothetical protein
MRPSRLGSSHRPPTRRDSCSSVHFSLLPARETLGGTNCLWGAGRAFSPASPHLLLSGYARTELPRCPLAGGSCETGLPEGLFIPLEAPRCTSQSSAPRGRPRPLRVGRGHGDPSQWGAERGKSRNSGGRGTLASPFARGYIARGKSSVSKPSGAGPGHCFSIFGR